MGEGFEYQELEKEMKVKQAERALIESYIIEGETVTVTFCMNQKLANLKNNITLVRHLDDRVKESIVTEQKNLTMFKKISFFVGIILLILTLIPIISAGNWLLSGIIAILPVANLILYFKFYLGYIKNKGILENLDKINQRLNTDQVLRANLSKQMINALNKKELGNVNTDKEKRLSYNGARSESLLFLGDLIQMLRNIDSLPPDTQVKIKKINH
ncbi:MAG: hypothetical protein PHE54_03305 [Bacilli bacterium]|nr:hypothetical protein [Bacilli bacterium]